MKNKNEVADAMENAMNVNAETPESTQGMQPENENTETGLTPEQQKASAILRARMSKLADAGLNFEKRSGSFFRASLVKEQEKDENGEPLERNGKPVYKLDENGNPIEKVRRLVVDLFHESEAATVATCLDEIHAKRAAAMVLAGDKGRAKLEADKAEAEKRVAECAAALATFDADMDQALAIVAATELPERAERTPRVAVAAKLANVQDENAKLRALLLAAGIDPDAQAQG